MTSEKYFSKWVREAGRGHLTALLAWGSLLLYGIITAAQLRFKSDYFFFGMGSGELLRICAGLGAVISFLEFFYLLQPKKLDFYYSLPVRKSTVFWSRYVHGLMHVFIPLCLVITACGLYESSFDIDFLPCAAGYTGRSILTFAGVFLIFYHVGILLLTVCGNVLPAVLGYVLCLFYGHILVGYALTPWAANYFRTYYRIPTFEKLDIMLAPFSLARELTGSNLFDKFEVFAYVPSGSVILAASEWIILPLLLFAAAQKKRKTERVGKLFAIPLAERAAECLLTFLAGVWSGIFLMELTGLTDRSPEAAGAAGIAAGIAAAAAVHFLLELGAGCGTGQKPGFLRGGIFRRKWQLAAACAAVVFTGMAFLAGASAFDSYLPKEGQVEKIGVSIDGIGMSNESYRQIRMGGERYETVLQLERYLLADEGKTAAAAWIKSLAEKNRLTEMPSTHAVICFHMKNGGEIYRLYPVYEEELAAFAAVYETEEYKRAAYPVADNEFAGDARFSWSDGVTENLMKLEKHEKEALLDACREDISDMKMDSLKETLLLGTVEIDSDRAMLPGSIPVYPCFTRTCSLLEQYGAPIDRTLADYSVRSVSVSTEKENVWGKRSSEYVDDPEEVEQWKQKAVPKSFDLQPLFYPLDYSKEIQAEVEDETTNSIIHVNCYSREE
ncbi:MAG: ABC transporter permease [Ruminococcus sp.]|nr:ABC transporter permease [Ruminococcus sp.]